jgi:hypothetical protein
MSKVGLTREAYRGSPKGVRSVSFEACELPNKDEKWYWRLSNSQHKLSTKYNLDWLRKKANIIDNM